jgi:protease PrsW
VNTLGQTAATADNLVPVTDLPGPGLGPTPATMPAGYPVPRPGRPRIRLVLFWVLCSLLIVAAGLLSLAAISTETGALGLVTGTVLAAIPVVPVIAAYLWLDRYEAEPPWLLAFAFAWGAGLATFGALAVNTFSIAAIKASGGDVTSAAVVVAPVVEETFKGLGVLVVLLLRRKEFDGVVDGLVYAGMVGVGFAFLENVLYLGRSLDQVGGGGTFIVFLLRCVVSPFAHPLFTGATGVGLGIAARARNPVLRVAAPVLGWCIAVVLHGLWNLSASSLQGFIAAYVLVQVPIFVVAVSLALYARRREGRLIGRHLAVYGTTGWLTGREIEMLASLPARRDARGWAGRTGGNDARRAMRDFQELGSELAFLRERMERGTANPDAPTLEYGMLTAMTQLRVKFVPRWATRPQT